MPVLNPTISRIYTPPTCTLEVTAQPSALSRWTRTPTLKSLQFLLSFDGLTQQSREPLTIRGNQTQLTALTDTITDYIQNLLARRHSDLPLLPSAASAASASSSPPPPFPPDSVPSFPNPPDALNPTSAPTAIQIRPRTLLTHELLLGDLATEQSGSSVVLKVSQLYDLATALDDCTTEFQQLPELAPPVASWRTTLLPLARSAAIVVLTVGLGTVTWRVLQPSFIAEKPASMPQTTTALAPKDSSHPASKALPSLKPQPSKSLALPKINLPQRSTAPFTVARSTPENQSSNSNRETDFLANSANSKKLAQSSPLPTTSLPSEIRISPNLPSGDIALAPAPTQSSSPSLESSSQSDTAASSTGTSSAGAGMSSAASSASDATTMSRMSKAASPVAPSTAANSSSSLFDTIPQVSEVRDYVAAKWSPTNPPPKTLEYRVTLNANGSLAQVEPLGAIAQQYLNQVPLPSPNTAFVSPVDSGGAPNIRLVLNPDGTVKTFLDTSGK